MVSPSKIKSSIFVIFFLLLPYMSFAQSKPFVFAKVTDNKTGEPLFEEMMEWNENREKAYKGSLRHFLNSLVDSSTIEEGFESHHMDAIPPDNYTNITIDSSDNLFFRLGNHQYKFNFDDFIKLVYLLGKSVETKWQVIRPNLLRGQSEIVNSVKKYPTSHLMIKKNPVYFDENGILFDSFNIQGYGTLQSHRVAHLLPRQYKPGKD